ncbi:MAG: membrane protein insertase YidC [Gemmatimonadales bacterium]
MDRRALWAVVLMMVIALVPTFLLKPKPRTDGTTGRRADTTQAVIPSPAPTAGVPLEASGSLRSAAGPVGAADTTTARAAGRITVASELYRYEFSTRGGALTQATILGYKDLSPEARGTLAKLIPAGGTVHTLAFTVGNDTISLADWDFVPATPHLTGAEGARELMVPQLDSLTLTGSRGNVAVTLTYRFLPKDYTIGVTGQVTGLGPVGGHLLVGMGQGLAQTEADSNANHYDFGVVTKTDESKLTRFSKLKPGETRTLEGPFEWAAVKAKYFVAALLAVDSSNTPLSGVLVRALPNQATIKAAAVTFALPVPASGAFNYRLYIGPMEYPRLHAIGHDFYDINPYGWPGFRTMIRPVAVAARTLLVWMHTHLNLAYGVVLIIFGIMIRVLLWPLNQRGMRASMKMQALQPEMQKLQDKHKEDPGALQKEVMGLYKREGVNPFSGCWPLLLPWPVMLALFFVLANSIELRGQAFLWLPDLSLKDPLHIIPVLMGASMFAVTKVGMKGMPPNPQSKMMLYFLPVMMTVMFLNFASGLNLYYFVQNVVSVPQQWWLAKERMKVQPQPVVVNTKKKK